MAMQSGSDPQVGAFIEKLDPEFREIASRIRKLIIEVIPDVSETFKWNQPVYERDGLICYIGSFKEHICLGFYHGAFLADPEKHLQGDGRQLRHIKINSVEDLQSKPLRKLLEQAASLQLR
ncbi:MAG: DUF1801 domain-containing protein [candidate division Zixibacteria bacterium]|nr:DUF1801 domain-containing protein [candidate division Zixibacteria bacterium]